MEILPRSGPTRCTNASDTLPELPYPQTCGISLFQRANVTTPPYDVLKSCCASGQVGYFPLSGDQADADCHAYCNSTSQAQQEKVHDCLWSSQQLSSFGCTSSGTSVGARNLGARTLVVVALMVSVVIGV